MKRLPWTSLLLLMMGIVGQLSAQRVIDRVNPIIGTNGMGHTFPGACQPFGLVQLSPDTDTIPHNIDGKYQPGVYAYCETAASWDSAIPISAERDTQTWATSC